MRLRTIFWQKLRRPEFEDAAAAGAIVILPLGTTEQHGLHAPVDTDINCAQNLAVAAAEQFTGAPVLIAPPVWSGHSPSFMQFAGTISISIETLRALLTETCRSIAAHGFKKILILNGHAGHKPIIEAMEPEMAGEGILLRGVTYWELIPEMMAKVGVVDKGSIGHAGEIETSLQLHFQPEHVDMTQAVHVPGVGGDPPAGTAEKGEQIAKAAADAVVEVLREMAAA